MNMSADSREKGSTEATVPGVSLRLARLADVDRLLPMMNDFNAGEGISVEPQRLHAALAELLMDDRLGRVWLIVDERTAATGDRDAAGTTDPTDTTDATDTTILGYAVLTFGYDLEFAGRDAFLTELYLKPPARGRRLGRRALDAIEVEAVRLGIAAIHLMVRPDNQRAFALYAAAHYEEPGRTTLSKELKRN
jgi:GNAT superfamily N-acetyltransferase